MRHTPPRRPPAGSRLETQPTVERAHARQPTAAAMNSRRPFANCAAEQAHRAASWTGCPNPARSRRRYRNSRWAVCPGGGQFQAKRQAVDQPADARDGGRSSGVERQIRSDATGIMKKQSGRTVRVDLGRRTAGRRSGKPGTSSSHSLRRLSRSRDVTNRLTAGAKWRISSPGEKRSAPARSYPTPTAVPCRARNR